LDLVTLRVANLVSLAYRAANNASVPVEERLVVLDRYDKFRGLWTDGGEEILKDLIDRVKDDKEYQAKLEWETDDIEDASYNYEDTVDLFRATSAEPRRLAKQERQIKIRERAASGQANTVPTLVQLVRAVEEL